MGLGLGSAHIITLYTVYSAGHLTALNNESWKER